MAEKKIVGIDFTSREVRIAQISYSRGMPKIERFALGEIPEGIFSGGRLVEPARFAEIIKDLIRGYRINARRAVLGISGKYGVTRMITLPKMTAAQTRDALSVQLNQYVPFPPGDTIYDFKTLREVKEEEQVQQEVLLVATRRSSIQPLLTVIKKAGLQLVGIKITTLASFGLFEDIYQDSEQAVAFVDVRDNVTDISFVSDNYFRLSRSVEFGISTLIERMRQKMGMTHKEAVDHLYTNRVDLMEGYRPSGDMTAEEGEVSPPPDVAAEIEGSDALDKQLGLAKVEEGVEKQVRDSILRAMGQFVNELMRSIRYFESQLKRRSRVGRVVVFGYIGGLDGLVEYLTEQTGLEVTVVTSLPGVESNLDAADEQEIRRKEAVLVVPIGLAVEGAKQKRIELNLVPRETIYRRKSFNALKFAVVIVVIIAAILANIYIQRVTELENFKDQEQELTQKIASIQHLYDRSTQFKQYINTMETKLSAVVTLAAMQPPWPVIMDEIGRLMRDTAWIDEFHWDANGAKWEIHGYCIGTREVQMLLVNFYHSDMLQNMNVDGLDSESDTEQDEGTLGRWFGSTGGASGFGYSSPAPGNGTGAQGRSSDPVSMLSDGQSETPVRPEPLYKLPEGGGSAWRDIEWYFQGHQYLLPIGYEFKFSGTINPAVMTSGKDLFGDLKDLVRAGGGGGGTTPPAGAPTGPGGAGPTAPGLQYGGDEG